jgi:hypothetical protein
MARISIDDVASGSSTSTSTKSKGHDHGHGHDGGRGHSPAKTEGTGGKLGSLDTKQKVKAIGSVVVILIALGFILWQTGVIGSSGDHSATAVDVTEEQVKAYNEQVQQQEAELRKSGSMREAPMPMGAN